MTSAPDGNLWFIDEIFPGAQTDVQVGMMAQSGTITWYPPLSNFGAGVSVHSGYITPAPPRAPIFVNLNPRHRRASGSLGNSTSSRIA
jgi:hypothetical protein